MNGNRPSQKDPRIAEQAAQWLDVLERGGTEERAAFAAWLTESRRHVEEFLFMSAVDKVLDGADSRRRIDVDALLAQTASNVVPLQVGVASEPAPKAAPRRQTKRRWVIGAAAAAALVAAISWFTLPSLSWDSYATGAGEQRTLELDDGSIVYLNTRSQLLVNFSEQGRDLRLLQGEAMFEVERDPARPFRVDTGNAVVQAVGTRFNIYRRSHDITVSVLEGAVRISSNDRPDTNMLKAGEEASIVTNGSVTRHAGAEVDRVEAWRQRRLIFRADTLADIATEFNRYNRAPKIRIPDEQVAARRFTGIFDANDPESLAAFLASYADLTVDNDGRELTVRTR